MKKNLKNFLLCLLAIVFLAFSMSVGRTKYQEYKIKKEIEKFKQSFNFSIELNNKEEKNKKENKIEELSYAENLKNSIKEKFFNEGYNFENKSLFNKLKLFLAGAKIEYLIIPDENDNGAEKKVAIISDSNKITVEESEDNNIVKRSEYFSEDNFQTVGLKIIDTRNNFVRNFENIEDGFGIDEFEDGSKIEFKHLSQVLSGPAVKYFKNGDREEFIYKNGIRQGFSTYYFTNGDKEEVYYINDILEGKAKYTYADGYVEFYRYEKGQRIE